MSYRLLQDDDCHWYLIPEALVEEFREWGCTSPVELQDLDPDEYEEYRIEGPHNIVIHDWSEL